MKTRWLRPWFFLFATRIFACSTSLAQAPASPEWLEISGGKRVAGSIQGDPRKGFRFQPADGSTSLGLQTGMSILHEGREIVDATGLPPFRVDLGLGQRLSGRLGSIDDGRVRLLDLPGNPKVETDRSAVQSIVQRPGEVLVFQEGFESLSTRRWTVVGEPDIADGPRIEGEHSLKLPAGGASLTHKLDAPFGSGRLEVAFHDGGAVAPGQAWFVDLTFRSPSGPETVRVLLGWVEDSLAVESPGGPALAVQRLSRKSGWHRLSVRFGAKDSEISADGNELAHGKGFNGPLVEVRLASTTVGKNPSPPPAGLAGHLDDLRLIRFAEPVSGLETDVTQDEVRLIGGDQLFGRVTASSPEAISLDVDGESIKLPWAEVSGLYLRRISTPGVPLNGLLVRAAWRAASGHDAREINVIEGALAEASASDFVVSTSYSHAIKIPRDSLTELRVLGKGRRIVLDSLPRHMGDEVSITAPLLDPPQSEGGILERTVDLADLPESPAFLVLDVLAVVGEAPDLPFSNLIKKGELRTNVKINGEPFDYLNHHISSKNETPETIRLPIPKTMLHRGKNTIRLEQVGIAGDPNFLDDLGILGMALEFPETPAPR